MKYFKTDGIRGKAYQEVTLELAFKLGIALQEICDELVIGIDTRISSIDLVKALISGYQKKYRFAGVIPTPGLMYYSWQKKIMAVMVTASHNPYYDNGFKIIEKGHKLAKNKQEIIEKTINELNVSYQEKTVDLDVDTSIINAYENFLNTKKHLSKKRIIFDGANGCYSDILKKMFDVDNIINCSPNGFNINEDCGSTKLTNLIKKVKETDSEYGIAFDGDGDRVLVVDKNNRIYQADFLIYLKALDLKNQQKLTGNAVVLSEICNPGIIEKLNQLGITTIITPVGDQNISKALAGGYVLGGEPSGHIINLLNSPFGDGLLNAFDILRLMDNYDFTLEYQKINFYYCFNENIPLNPQMYLALPKVNKKILKNTKNIIIRESGTEHVVRVTWFQKEKSEIKFNKMLRRVKKCIKKR